MQVHAHFYVISLLMFPDVIFLRHGQIKTPKTVKQQHLLTVSSCSTVFYRIWLRLWVRLPALISIRTPCPNKANRFYPPSGPKNGPIRRLIMALLGLIGWKLCPCIITSNIQMCLEASYTDFTVLATHEAISSFSCLAWSYTSRGPQAVNCHPEEGRIYSIFLSRALVAEN